MSERQSGDVELNSYTSAFRLPAASRPAAIPDREPLRGSSWCCWQRRVVFLVGHGGKLQLSKCHQHASVVPDEVLSCFSPPLPCSFSFPPRCFSAFNPFPRSISKHALCVTGAAFLALRTLFQTPVVAEDLNSVLNHAGETNTFGRFNVPA